MHLCHKILSMKFDLYCSIDLSADFHQSKEKVFTSIRISPAIVTKFNSKTRVYLADGRNSFLHDPTDIGDGEEPILFSEIRLSFICFVGCILLLFL